MASFYENISGYTVTNTDKAYFTDIDVSETITVDGQLIDLPTLANLVNTPTFTGVITSQGLDLGDNKYIKIGTGNDLEIYHDGADSYIKDAGTGDLNIQGQNVAIQNVNGGNIFFANSEAAFLDWRGSSGAGTKLTTTATGIDVTGTVTADLITLHPTGGAGEGGQVQFQRESDSTVDWYIDAYGQGTTTDLRFVNTGTGSDIIPFRVYKDGIYVEGEALGNNVGDETIQAEFRSINANKSKLIIKDERWADGSNWFSASKVLQFRVDESDHAYIASSTQGSGTSGIEIGTHDNSGNREKFFVGEANGGAYLFHNNVKKLQTTDDGVVITSGNTDVDVQPHLILRSEEPRGDDNQLGGITFQGSFADGIPRSYGFFRAESPVSTTGSEEGRFRFFVRKANNLFHNVLNLASNGIDVDGGVFADYINLNGNNPNDLEAVNTGDVLCKRIRFDDPTTNYNDLFQIYAEKDLNSGDVGAMVLEAKDNLDDKIIFRMGNWNETGAPLHIDILTATSTDITIPATKRLKFGTDTDGHLELFEANDGTGTIKQVGTGNLAIQGQNGYLQNDAGAALVAWDADHSELSWQGTTGAGVKLATIETGISVTGGVGADRYYTTETNTDSNYFSRTNFSTTLAALYVQRGEATGKIASFRKGSVQPNQGTEVLGVLSTGIDVSGTANVDNLKIGHSQGLDGQVLKSTGSGVQWADALTGTVNANFVNLTDTSTSDRTKPEIRFRKDAFNSNGDVLGRMVFSGDDKWGVDRPFAEITGIARSVPDGLNQLYGNECKGAIHFNVAADLNSDQFEQPACVIDQAGVHINTHASDGSGGTNHFHVANTNLAGTKNGGLKFHSHTIENSSNKTSKLISKPVLQDVTVEIPNVNGSVVVASIAGGSINGGGGTTGAKTTWSESDFSANANTTYIHYNAMSTADLTVAPDYPSSGFGEFCKFVNASPQASDVIIDLDGYSGSSVASYALLKTDGSLNATVNTTNASTVVVAAGGYITLTKVALAVYMIEGIGYTYS